MQKQSKKPIDLSYLADNWPSPIVSRDKLTEFSGGLLHPRTTANHDCFGTGPKGAIRVGRKVAYPVKSLIEWMEKRATPQKNGGVNHGHYNS
ncbi:hypothetical protein PITCH_A230010 [uncultured Desulfobacterium sp.]|uniref:Uncharacterized protein n=1 Tax=uncultured Desulfobacterium sp. TaxID=201089 RepID=A0A445MXR9_9BACT|nr:hypothetical protein PITCH_A230010 [uncultured Desulfobacterium sp.]